MKKLLTFFAFNLFAFMLFAQQELLELEGAVRIGMSTTDSAGVLRYNAGNFEGYNGLSWDNLSGGGAASPWTMTTLDRIYYNSGFVGIGNTSPIYDLDVTSTGAATTFGLEQLDGTNSAFKITASSTATTLYSRAPSLEIRSGHGVGGNTTTAVALETSGAVHFKTNSTVGARLSIENSAEAEKVVLAASAGTSLGAMLEMDNFAGDQAVSLLTNSSSTRGATLNMEDFDGSTTVRLNADYLGYGGALFLENESSVDRVRLRANESSTKDGAMLQLFDDNGSTAFFLQANSTAGEGAMMRLYDDNGSTTITLDADFGTTGGSIALDNEVSSERLVLRANESASSDGAYVQLKNSSGASAITMEANEGSTDGAAIKLYNAAGDLSIELDAEYQNGGDGRITTDVLEIKGGADFAENFNVMAEDKSTILPGYVVSIDAANPGALKITDQANDKKVAGIISGANGVKAGMIMGQKNTIANGDYPVALSGRVYVYANTENGQIEAGDFLTSSNTPGYAMKADMENFQHGTIVGKAMTGLVDKNGFVLVLVNLQ